MPLTNLLTLTIVFVAAAVIYAFRNRLMAPLRRFEAQNAERRAEEARALYDRYAHYRQTLKVAEEQVEEVAKIQVSDERTGQPVDRYLFLGVQYATRTEAEAARYAEIVGLARDFYIDLDTNWLPRGTKRHEALSAILPPPSKKAER